MSLLAAITNSIGSLQTAQIGLQTVGANIANADTPGYIRQELVQTTPAPNRMGNLILGHGVRAAAIVQKVDQALMERMWAVGSDLAGAQLRDRSYGDIENLLNDLNGSGLSDDLASLNAALQNLAAEPNNMPLRQFVLMSADNMTREMNRIATDARLYQTQLDSSVLQRVERVNTLTSKVASLNLEIMNLEGGRALPSDASGLRDERYRTIEELARLVKINVQEQSSGAVTIFAGGDHLVTDTHAREVYFNATQEFNRGKVLFRDNNAQLALEGGELKALTDGKDELVLELVSGLDQIASDLVREFNTIHAQGQGSRGFDRLVGTQSLDPSVEVNSAGLSWEIQGGTFEISLVDKEGNHISRHRIEVRPGALPQGSTVQSILDSVNAIDGLRAAINGNGKIELSSTLPNVRFTFGEDTSGFVAAAGLNTFFEGHSAETIRVNSFLLANTEYLAISSGGINQDTNVLGQMVNLIDRGIERNGGASISDAYQQMVGQFSQAAANQKAVTSGLTQYHATLQGEHLAISGVSIDEEAIKLLGYQRVFQASSRVIAAANEMLELLVSL